MENPPGMVLEPEPGSLQVSVLGVPSQPGHQPMGQQGCLQGLQGCLHPYYWLDLMVIVSNSSVPSEAVKANYPEMISVTLASISHLGLLQEAQGCIQGSSHSHGAIQEGIPISAGNKQPNQPKQQELF